MQAALAAQGIDTMVYYPVPCHRLPIYDDMDVSMPNAERLAGEVLSLPIWPQMDDETQDRVIEAVAASAASRS